MHIDRINIGYESRYVDVEGCKEGKSEGSMEISL
jgi:hypothetical protein